MIRPNQFSHLFEHHSPIEIRRRGDETDRGDPIFDRLGRKRLDVGELGEVGSPSYPRLPHEQNLKVDRELGQATPNCWTT